jgi:hypothetical protein
MSPYGDRVFECIDPFGYLWEISQPISDIPTDEAVASVQDGWYGTYIRGGNVEIAVPAASSG